MNSADDKFGTTDGSRPGQQPGPGSVPAVPAADAGATSPDPTPVEPDMDSDLFGTGAAPER